MAGPATITAAERRRRLLVRHRIGTPAATVEDAVRSVLVLHATDPASVYLSVLARCPTATIDDVSEALYARRSLVRLMAMRRTLFVVPQDLVPVVHHGAAVEIAAKLRAGLLRELQKLPTDPPFPPGTDLDAWLRDVEDSTEQALRVRGVATAAELASDEPRLRTATLPATTKRWDVRRNLTSRVLTLLGADARAVRGRPRGAWTSRAHTWEPATTWWPDGIADLSSDDAAVALAGAWLRVFGPATVADLQWWTGWTLTRTRRALASLDTTAVDLEGVEGILLTDDQEPAPDPADVAAETAVLLPGLDPTPMGWKHRDWFLGPHRSALFDAFGNIGPTIWWQGRVIGGWAIRPDGEIVTRLLEDCGRTALDRVDEAAHALATRLDGTVVVPSFRTPLERELSAPAAPSKQRQPKRRR